MNPDIRNCITEDGVRIAYCVHGEGPDIVFCPDFVGSFSLDHLIENQMGFWRGLWHGRRVIRYDMRGTGLSQSDIEDCSHDALVRDLAAVVKASGAREFTLWGGTLSGPRAIAYAARHPRQVRRLVLQRTFARAEDVLSGEQVRIYADLARHNWPQAAQLFADLPARRQVPDAGLDYAQQYVQSTTGAFVAQFLTEGLASTDVSAVLKSVRTPTLVMHWTGDHTFPFRLAKDLAAQIPHARLAPLEEGISQYLASGKISTVIDLVNEFIDDGAAGAHAARPARSIQAVLWTDLVSHTQMMRRLGDEGGRAVLRDHERITREALREHGGSEVKAMGDGFLATFGSVTAALDCAIALQRRFADHSRSADEPLVVRMGINAGEPIEEDSDLFGSTVILASRIAASAGAGEILIPEPVRHLASGKTYLYSDRGDSTLKGFEDPVRLYAVRWQDT